MSRYKQFAAVAAASFAAGSLYYSSSKDYNVLDGLRSVILKNDVNNNFISTTAKSAPEYESAIRKSRIAVNRLKLEAGVPGIVIGVSVDGEIVWNEGFGYANVETETPCDMETKMRIASISKPITIGLLAKLMESGAVDIDRPIQDYVPYFPRKTVNGKPVTITTRMLASHTAGIRHYKNSENSEGDGGPEFYLKERFENVEKSVNLFKDDDLLFIPGNGYEYTTHGFTLLSAVIEGAGKSSFSKQLTMYLKLLGLTNTHLDEVPTIIYGRSSYYTKNKNGRLVNAELTDNSYKWAGGGLVANTEDLLKFANIMLYSYQRGGFLKQDTVRQLWTGVEGTKKTWGTESMNGLGWTVVSRSDNWQGGTGEDFHVGHSGGAVGASSVLLIFPDGDKSDKSPAGVAVAVLGNLQNVGFYKMAKEVADYFHQQSKQNASE